MKRVLKKLVLLGACIITAMIIGCPIYRFIGIRCPVCGTTRAFWAFFRGDLQSAFTYNVFFLQIPFLLAYAVCRDVFSAKKQVIGDSIVLAVAVLMFFYNIIRIL